MIFISSVQDLTIAKKGLEIIESNCDVKFSYQYKIKNYRKKIYHSIYNIKKFNYQKELNLKGYNIFITNKNHKNFSYNNSIWVSNKKYYITPNSVAHELMHMLTGRQYHFGKNHILADFNLRNNKIINCKEIKIDNWKNKNSFDLFL